MTAKLHDFALQCLPGAGYVGRAADACIAIVPSTDRQADATHALLTLWRSSEASGRKLVRRVVAIIADAEPDDVPPLALACAVDGDLVVLVQGDITATATSADGETRLSGADVVSWTERRVPLPIVSLEVRAASAAPADFDAAFDLRDGLVPGAGFLLAARGAPVPGETPHGAAPQHDATPRTPHAPPPPPPPQPLVPEPAAQPAAEAPAASPADQADRTAPTPVVGAEDSAGARARRGGAVRDVRVARRRARRPPRAPRVRARRRP